MYPQTTPTFFYAMTISESTLRKDTKLTQSYIDKECAQKILSPYKSKVSALVDRTIDVRQLHEVNRVVFASDVLSKQIPSSYAANAFVTTRIGLIHIEIIKLISLWDKGNDGCGIMGIIGDLESNKSILEAIKTDTFHRRNQIGKSFFGEKHTEEEKKYFIEYIKRKTEEEAHQIVQERELEFKKIIDKARELHNSSNFTGLYDLRTKLAHPTQRPRETVKRQKENPDLVLPDLNFNLLDSFLSDTVEIVKQLHLCIEGAGFTWNDHQKMWEDYSKELWENCTFSIPQA